MIDLSVGGARASISPERGALVTRWGVGEELLYLDEATFREPSKNVRGGIPVLFPSPGKLRDDRFAGGAMKQHGFARNLAWTVLETTASTARLSLASSDATRAQYPFDFVATLTFTLGARSLRIEQRVESKSAEPMPFGFGFHPYFAVPVDEKAGATIETSATRAFDNVQKKDIDLHGIDLAHGEVDLHLLDHDCTESELAWFAGTRKVRVRASKDYRRWVIWTLPDKPFVCLEPWTCPGDALNTGEGLITLDPGQSWEGFVELVAPL